MGVSAGENLSCKHWASIQTSSSESEGRGLVS